MRSALATVLVAGVCAAALPARADAIRCTTFLHNRDGSWRSFSEADVDAPDGIIHLRQGEILRPGERSAKGDLARALDDYCGH